MKAVLWSISLILALLWSGAVALMHSLAGWAASAAGAADAQTLASLLRDWPLPAWFAWADPAMVESLRLGLSAFGSAVVIGQPWLVAVIGWVGPLLWIMWALGIALLLALTSLGHFAIGRWVPRQRLTHSIAGSAGR
ncbi:hypothetical protein OPU71_06405 [Niveibacterium sp. 24ML]|uniref:hypothetical protein n=1 Tax=Niveibacterium sp. 24ML TaxID=2985512 RepID=UPI00226E2302|nr:hypothetical protein [Niveibacterium sp. 24ML]MCX9155756.1 hypothetical protein [Niveibacterium sp. 24ML]